jgi:uncharacterized protein YbjQ (UPF0145 family)
MQVVTTPSIEGQQIVGYLGLVSGDAILGANLLRDISAGIRDLLGGRVKAYEEKVKMGKQTAIREMVEEATGRGATAIIGVSMDYEFINMRGIGGMIMVSVTGTAVQTRDATST